MPSNDHSTATTVIADPEKAATPIRDSTATEEKPVEQKPPAVTFPEGGYQGYMTLAGATLVQYVTFGYANSFGVYQDYYVREYLPNYTPSEIGWIGGIQIFLIFSSGIFTGRAFDRGYFYHLMIAGAFLHALGLFMLSLSHTNKYYQVILAQGVCLGLSAGLCYIPSLTVVSHYFQKRRPFAMGIVAGGSALGAVLHPIMLNRFFNGGTNLGFHNGVRVSAAINTFLLIIANFMMRTRLPPKKGGKAIPIAEFSRDPPYVFVCFAGILLFGGLFFPVFYLQLNAISHGVDHTFSFYSLPVLNAASVFGRTIPPIFAHKFGVFNLAVFFTVSAGIVTCTLAAVKDTAGVALIAIFYGFFSGATISLVPPMLGVLSRDMSEIGARIGIDFFFCGFLGLFATSICGALLGTTGTSTNYHWLNASLFAGIMMICSGFFFGVSRRWVALRKGTQIV